MSEKEKKQQQRIRTKDKGKSEKKEEREEKKDSMLLSREEEIRSTVRECSERTRFLCLCIFVFSLLTQFHVMFKGIFEK